MKSLFEPSEKMREAMSTAIAELMAMSTEELMKLGQQYADTDTVHFLAECNHAFEEIETLDDFVPRDGGVGQWVSVSYSVAPSTHYVRASEAVRKAVYHGQAMANAMADSMTSALMPPQDNTCTFLFASAA